MTHTIRNPFGVGSLTRRGMILLLAFAITAAGIPQPVTQAQAPAAVGVPAAPIAESDDFATTVLRDPWDMSEYSDVSQYLNESGQRSLVSGPAVQNGVFTGTSVGDAMSGNAYWFPLFPGYATTVLEGKVGHNYPLDAAKYHCLYVAMKVNSGPAIGGNPDQFRVFWFADEWLNMHPATNPFGVTVGMQLYPESGANQPAWAWKLYKVDLATQAAVTGSPYSPWSARAAWQGIRVDPTIQAGVSFAVDWARMTSCQASLHTVTWQADANVKALWVRPEGTTRYIRVADPATSGFDGRTGRYDLDTQGLMPGRYYVGVGAQASCCSQESATPLVISPMPVARFTRPSATSGRDYSTSAGAAWDFSQPTDAVDLRNFSYTGFADGLLSTVTSAGPLPAGQDAQVFLNMPQPLPIAGDYRYLTFRMNSQWAAAWQDVPDGMIVRWMWYIQGTSGRQGYRCAMVSHDIPFDIGWRTYTIDLFDPFNGSPILYSPSAAEGIDCIGAPTNWRTSGQVFQLRFDPNENITCLSKGGVPCSDFTQSIDWIRLTAEDTVAAGIPYNVEMETNIPANGLSGWTVYYTTDPRGAPRQSRARQAVTGSPALPPVAFFPLVLGGPAGLPGSGASTIAYSWDTSGVAPGAYYVCVDVSTALATSLGCSEAPVRVTAP